MKKTGKRIVLFTALAGIFVFVACNKNEIETENVITKTSTLDYINMVSSFSLSTEEEITSSEENDLKSAEVLGCLSVTVHENENGEFWPRSWTLDYGTENCTCYFGNSKRGKIHVTLSDWWRNQGSLREITFEDYYFNDNKLEGSKTILNNGLNEDGNLSFTKNINDARLTYNDGSSITWNCEKYSELIEGGNTFVFADDVWSVTGFGSGVDLDGNEYTMEITSPLIYHNGCFYPVSGVVEIVTEDVGTKVIDYGNGECDNLITVTENGVSEVIEI